MIAEEEQVSLHALCTCMHCLETKGVTGTKTHVFLYHSGVRSVSSHDYVHDEVVVASGKSIIFGDRY